jgi:hypothetical protein
MGLQNLACTRKQRAMVMMTLIAASARPFWYELYGTVFSWWANRSSSHAPISVVVSVRSPSVRQYCTVPMRT